MEKHCFMHISILGSWELVVNDQLDKLYKSGLYDELDKIHLTILGNYNNELELKDKMEIVYQSKVLREHEVPSLQAIKEFSDKNEAKILYIHSKGVTHKRPKKIKNIKLWREYMEYFLIEKYGDCLRALEDYDACGVDWKSPPKYPECSFDGNFWWARSDYIRTLKPPQFMSNRSLTETWIGTNEKVKIKSFFQSNRINLYDSPIFRHIYDTNLLHNISNSWGNNTMDLLVSENIRLPSGAFFEGDQQSYKSIVKMMPTNSTMVEVGVFCGRSLCSIARSISEKNIKVFAVDHFIGSKSEPDMVTYAKINNIYEIFLNNIKKFNIASNINTLKMDSVEASKKFADDSVDLVFIDGDHSYEFVKRDLETWYSKVKIGGFIGGHDYDLTHKGLIKAVTEFFLDRGAVEKPASGTSVWFHQKV